MTLSEEEYSGEVCRLKREICHYWNELEMVKIVQMLKSDEIRLQLFNGFTHEQREELDPNFTQCHYSAGEVILRQNQPALNIFIVTSGEIEISHLPYDGPSMEVDRLTEGDVFGWSAILGRDVYTATAKAIKETSALRISSEKLHQFCEHHHDTGVVLLKKMALTVSSHPSQPVDQIMGLINQAMECHPDHKI